MPTETVRRVSPAMTDAQHAERAMIHASEISDVRALTDLRDAISRHIMETVHDERRLYGTAPLEGEK